VSNTPALPTGDFYDSIMPGRDERPAARAAAGAGSLFGGAGLPQAARAVQKVAAPVAKGALDTIRRGMEGQGPLSGLVAPAAPMYAMRPRGGNFKNPDVSDLGGWFGELPMGDKPSPQRAWADKVLRNYVKRDLGAPTDPLLALEAELPGLHLPQGHLEGPNTEDIADLYFARQLGRDNPSRLDPGRSGPTSEKVQRATAYLDRHDELTGGARLTPWGRVSDAEVLNGTAGKDLAATLEAQWPLPGMYPDGMHSDGSLQDLIRHTETIMDRYTPDMHETPAYKKLVAYRAKIDDAMANDWRAKKPDDPMYELMGGAGERLGFDHIMDYIEAATDPYTRIGQNFPKGVSRTPGGVDDYTDAVNQFLNGPGFDAFDGMHPYRRDVVDGWRDMKNAGLLIDPASLDRMSMPDMVKKVAKWNEYMESKKSGQDAEKLMKGAKVFKEYGEDAGPSAGMKWVEFADPGKPGEAGANDPLPEGYRLVKTKNGSLPDDHPSAYSYWISDAEDKAPQGKAYFSANTPEKATEAFWQNYREDKLLGPLREGLKAEGDAMGHCVGGYCDDVVSRGTKIYSLRDAKGQPHVTIEVGPGDMREYLRNTPDPDYVPRDLLDSKKRSLHERIQDERVGNGDYDEYALSLVKRLGIPMPPPQIIQIKGKGNAAPAEKYRAAVQDFVRSGTWGAVGDLRNTGLKKIGGKFFSEDELRAAYSQSGHSIPFDALGMDYYDMLATTNGMSADTADRAFMRALGFTHELDQRPLPPPGYAHGGLVRSRKAAESDAPKGFLPRSFPEWVEYAERVYADNA
jgi:hypothetical protein